MIAHVCQLKVSKIVLLHNYHTQCHCIPTKSSALVNIKAYFKDLGFQEQCCATISLFGDIKQLHTFAHTTNIQPGDFIHTLGDAHVYLNHIEPLKIQVSHQHKLPMITLNDSYWSACSRTAPLSHPGDY